MLNDLQIYCIIVALFICLIVLIISVKEVIKNISKDACIGCKRLAKCENAINEIKKTLSINDYFDKQTFINISQKLDKLAEEIQRNG